MRVKDLAGKRFVKVFTFKAENVDTEERTFEGYASVFGNIDSYGEIVEPGAFRKTIKERFKKNEIKILWQHNSMFPLGLPLDMKEDDHGLWVKGHVDETSYGNDALISMRSGTVDGLSIGYEVVIYEIDNEEEVIRLKELKLWEFSPVTFPANNLALIENVKAMGAEIAGIGKYVGTPSKLDLESALRYIGDAEHDVKSGRVLRGELRDLAVSARSNIEALLEATEPDKGKSTEPDDSTLPDDLSTLPDEEADEIIAIYDFDLHELQMARRMENLLSKYRNN
jgi:HK97 family phage prohead protease